MNVFDKMERVPVLGMGACPGPQRVARADIPRYLANAALIDAREATGPFRFYEARLMIAHIVAQRFPCFGPDDD